MANKSLVSVVLGTYNRLSFLKLTVDSIREEGEVTPYEIIIVDGGSTDGTLRWLTKQKDIVTIVQHNHGNWRGEKVIRRSWGYFMNLGFKMASGKYICMLSDDCLLVPGAIRNGCRFFEERMAAGVNLGALAFFWRDWPKEACYRVGLTLGSKMYVNHGMYLRKALQAVGYIDEGRYVFYHADGDLCLKMWEKGYSCEASPDSYVEHYPHANRLAREDNLSRQQADWRSYVERWGGIFYDRASNETGGWIQKSHTDTFRTAQRIRGLHLYGILKQIVRVAFDFRHPGQRIRKFSRVFGHEIKKQRA